MCLNILTKVYYEHVLGSNKELQNVKENIDVSDIESEEEEYDR